MTYDHKALEGKKRAIVVDAETALGQHLKNPTQLAASIVAAFTHLTPPTQEQHYADFIVVNMGTRRGSSRKPGNLYLNWQKLMDTIPDVTVAGAGGATGPVWLMPFVGLYIWNKIWCGAKEEFSESEAVMMFSLWKNRDGKNKIYEDHGYEVTNKTRLDVGMTAISRAEYDLSINRLLHMKCIELNEGLIWLREWVRVSYS